MSAPRSRDRRFPANPRATSDPGGFPQWEHDVFTFEGEMERLGAMGRNMSTAPRWARVVARVMAVLILAPLAVGRVAYAIRLVTR